MRLQFRVCWTWVFFGLAGAGVQNGSAAPPTSREGKGGDDPNAQTGFISKEIQRPDGTERRYVVFIPRGYSSTKAWPTLLFLHGAGQRGDDNAAQVQVGIGPYIRGHQDTFGFITVMPQCQRSKWWTMVEEKSYALAALARTQKEYRVDPSRICLTGISMGGMGTWTLAADHPDMWSAIVPICGPGDLRTASKIAPLPCWCFHGTSDTTVPIQMSRNMIAALKRYGGQPRYTEYEGVKHNCWDRAYATEELYTWILAQQRK